MKIFLPVLSILLCCALFMGAVGLGAPVMPSKNFYINDYAGVIEQENRDNMLKTAQELYEKAGVQVVVLTIESFGGHDPAEYGESVFDSWEIGGADKNGMLILLCTEDKQILTSAGVSIAVTYSMELADKIAAEGNFDDAVSAYFFAVIDSVYSKYPVKESAGTGSKSESVPSVSNIPNDTIIQSIPETQNTEASQNTQSSRSSVFYTISFTLFLLIAFRAIRISSRYRKKYNNNKSYYRGYTPGYVYQRTPARPAREDDGDYPSGFGGLGNRKAIYGEDVDEAEDIGIIKHDYDNVFDEKEQDEQNPDA